MLRLYLVFPYKYKYYKFCYKVSVHSKGHQVIIVSSYISIKDGLVILQSGHTNNCYKIINRNKTTEEHLKISAKQKSSGKVKALQLTEDSQVTTVGIPDLSLGTIQRKVPISISNDLLITQTMLSY